MSYDSNEVLDDCGTSSVSNDNSSCDITEYMWTRSLDSVKITREREREREREGKEGERERERGSEVLCTKNFAIRNFSLRHALQDEKTHKPHPKPHPLLLMKEDVDDVIRTILMIKINKQ